MNLLNLLKNDSWIYRNTFNLSMCNQRKPLHKALYFEFLESELRGKHLNIATLQNGALSGAVKINNTWVGRGIAFDIVELLQEFYNFDYTIMVPLENNLGSKNEGVFGLIYKEKVDLAAAFLPLTRTYLQYADFGTGLDVGEWVGIFKRPHASGAGSGIFAPFTFDVWFLIIASIFATGFVIFIILLLSITSHNKKYSSFQDCLLFVYGALLKQSSTLKSRSVSSRLAFASWWIFVMLITAFYTANLTAFLTLSETKLPVKNSREIVTKRYSIISKAGDIIEETITNNLEYIHNIFQPSQKVFVKEDDMFILNNWIRNQHFVYLADKPNIDISLYKNYLKYLNTDTPQTERCSFVYTSWPIFKWVRSFAYSKKFKYKPLFNRALRVFVEMGLVKHKFKKYIPVANYCPLNLHTQERPLSSADYLITYYILITGFLVSLIIFFLELLVFVLKKKLARRARIKRMPVKRYPMQLDANLADVKTLKYSSVFRKKNINGRDYWITTFKGEIRLVPIRTPSAIIFHATIEDLCK
ncbi:hypothetical protein FQR65_LT08675 [Abscondita terminalis]|nr:hypothetical protein FQR65_LT08675 [Abscondita terminalis]